MAEKTLAEYEIEDLRMMRRMQPTFRQAASLAGFFNRCPLPKCRRAKQCSGCHPADEIGTTHYKTFPPCVFDNDTQAALLHAARRIADGVWQSRLASGLSVEEIKRLDAETDAAILREGGWPEDPLQRPVGRASRKGR